MFICRATETGEGKYYFIGHCVKEFFCKLKDNIVLLSKSSSLKRESDALNSKAESYTNEDDSCSTGGSDELMTSPGPTGYHRSMLPIPSSPQVPTHSTHHHSIDNVVPSVELMNYKMENAPRDISFEYQKIAKSTRDISSYYDMINTNNN